MEKILVTIGERFAPEACAMLETIGTVECARVDRKELLQRVKDATVLIVGLEHRLDAEVLAAAPHLKMIATATTGLDHIDTAAAQKHSINVLSLRTETEFLGSITSTAELALGLMIALVRAIPDAVAAVKAGQWDRSVHNGHSLSGKILGIVGLGRLGSLMARYGKALGMKVIYCDPKVQTEEYLRCELQDLLMLSDIISVHVHLDEKTQNLFDAAAFRTIKRGAYLVNTARGAIVDEHALIDALNRGMLAGYAADVVAGESADDVLPSSALLAYAASHGNVILTPHIGGMTEESRRATDIRIVEMVMRMLKQ